MTWLARSLAGPGIWALAFAATYALHGAGCALGWAELYLTASAGGGLDLHRALLLGCWIGALVAGGALVIRLSRAGGGGGALHRRLPVAGAWIGLVASLITLAPVVLTTSC